MPQELIDQIKELPLCQIYMMEREIQTIIQMRERDEKNYLEYAEKNWD